MKRILSILLILILSLGVLCACQPKDTTPTESEYDVAAARDYVRSLYIDKEVTKVDYTLICELNFYGVKFTVEWSVDNEAITLEPSEDGLEVTVKVPSNPTEDINYKLTGKVTAPDNFSENVVFDLVVPAPKAEPVLDMMGETNLVSKTNEQAVFLANGVKFTNDKGSSTTNIFTNGYAYRAYSQSTVKIEYPGMRKIVLTLDDYSPEAGKDYLKGFDGMQVTGAVIIRNNDVVSIYFPAGPVNEFVSTPLASQTRIEKIEVFTTLTAEDNAAISGAGNQGGTTETYEAPVAGTAYKFYLYQADADKIVYFKAGALDQGKFLPTTENFDEATDIFFEVVDGGYHIYYMDGETTTYFNTAPYLNTKGYAACNFAYGTEPNCVWTFNEALGIFEVYVEIEDKNDTFFAGTYTYNGTPYMTISLSGAYYKNQITTGTQYPARISATSNGAVSKPTTNPDQGGDQPTTPTYTAPETGKAYKFYLEQKLQNKNFYFNGGSESYGGGYIFQTSESSDDAVEIFFETNGNGYNIYFYNADNVKTYFDVAPYSGGTPFKCQFKLSTEVPSTVWTFDTTYGVIKASVTFEGNTAEFYAGNYDSGTTIRLSNYNYVGQLLDTTKNQYAARIELADGTIVNPDQGGSDVGGDETCEHSYVDGTCSNCGEADPNYQPPSEGGDGDNDGLMTIPEVLAAAEGTVVKFTGTVHSFYEEWSSYNNCSPYIVDEAGNKILVFRTTTKVTIGDVVTVEGTVTYYNEVAQVAQSGSVVTIDVAHVCSSWTEPTCGKDSACTICGAAGEAKATGTHTYVDGLCTVCGASEASMKLLGTLSFSSTDNRTTFTTSQQVWAANGITLTNNKGSSTSNVADYSNPARFYKSSQLIIEATGILKIEFTCNSASYASALQSSITAADGVNVSISGSVVTVTFADAVDSFTIASLTGGQVRMNSLTVYVAE